MTKIRMTKIRMMKMMMMVSSTTSQPLSTHMQSKILRVRPAEKKKVSDVDKMRREL